MSGQERCAQCGRPRKGRFLWSDGDEHYCNACYQREFEPSKCVDCGKATRKHPSHQHPRCCSCRRNYHWRGVLCARCGCTLEDKPSKRGYSQDGKPRCASCAKYFWPPKTCVYCGVASYDVARDYQHGFDEPACGKCRREAGMHNCEGCHRNRKIAGEREGKRYCKHCLPTGKPPLIVCTACGQTKHAYSRTECEDCGWSRLNEALVQSLYPRLSTEWARALFARYHRESAARSRKGRWRACLRRDIDAFVMLEKAFPGGHEMTGVMIVRRLGTTFTNSYQRVMSFLAHAGLIELYDDPDYRMEYHLAKIRSLIPDDGGWVAEVLKRFLARLMHDRDKVVKRRRRSRVPTAPKSVESVMRMAHALLIAARDEFGVVDVRGLTQQHVDTVIARKRGYRVRVAAFLHYFNLHERAFQRLKTYRVPVAFPQHRILPEATCRRLIAWARNASRLPDVRTSLVILFGLLYAQPTHRSLATRLDAITETADGYQIAFAKVPVDLDPLTVEVLRRWLSLRRESSVFDLTGSSVYLFPGGVATTHATPDTPRRALRGLGVSPFTLHITGLASLVRSGIDQPRVLADTFGVSLPTAMKYCEALGAFERQRAKFAVTHYAQR